ncbi:MAG TPA: DinB family protein [Thermoanaerobaculia bacterium]|nr:DinB family protein [Thermoanaerobaculia bacterium]
MPTVTELLLAELEREGAGTRRTLERVPEGRNDWKPHEKSMDLGYLSGLLATMPAWIKAIVRQDSLDLAKPGEFQSKPFETNRELLAAFDHAMAEAREALEGAADEHLMTTSWQLKVQGQVVSEDQRYIAIRDSVLNHLVHHRAQLTVYLRLNDIPVPSLYGPSADEKTF